MTDRSLESLLQLHDRLADDFQELRESILKAIRISEQDSEMALTRVRKVLELVVCDVFETRYDEAAGTRPLENLLQRLTRDGHLPKLLAANANHIRELGNIGAHRHSEPVTKRDVLRSLDDLTTILEWYIDRVRPDAVRKREKPSADPGRGRDQAAGPADPPEKAAASAVPPRVTSREDHPPKTSPSASGASRPKNLLYWMWFLVGAFVFAAVLVVLERHRETVGDLAITVCAGAAALFMTVCMVMAIRALGRKR